MVHHEDAAPPDREEDPATTLWLWAAVAVAVLALALAGLAVSLGLPSECSTRVEIRAWPSLPVFLAYVAAGAWVAWRGSRPQRLSLFVASSVIAILYVVGLSMTVPEVIRFEIFCATQEPAKEG
jgi:hypothetical protein